KGPCEMIHETDDPPRWLCLECRYIGHEPDFQKVKTPSRPSQWAVCPNCKTPDSIAVVCDEPGSTKESACGFPTSHGYRHTCFEHSDMAPFTKLKKGLAFERARP